MEPEYIGVCIIVLDENGNVLLGERKNGYKSGTLGLPGGRIEIKEPLEKCGKRELLEETSLISNSLKYVGVIRELQKDYNFIHFVYSCNDYSGTPANTEPDKCKGWEWYSLAKLPDNILPGHKGALEVYINKTLSLKELLD